MQCPDCGGNGSIDRPACVVDEISYPEMSVTCYSCAGAGEICDVCKYSIDRCEGHEVAAYRPRQPR